jgi:hypothetical protein
VEHVELTVGVKRESSQYTQFKMNDFVHVMALPCGLVSALTTQKSRLPRDVRTPQTSNNATTAPHTHDMPS